MLKQILITALSLLIINFSTAQTSTSAVDHYNAGEKLKDAKKIIEAIEEYKKAISINPGYKAALYKIGWCFNDLEKYNDAIPYLKKAIQVDEKYVNAITELGYSDYALQNYDDALVQFKKSIAIEKTELNLYYAGLCYVGKKQNTEALKMVNALTLMKSDYADKLQKKIDDL